MTATASPELGQIHALLAERGYEVTEPSPDSLNIRETDSGVSIHAVVQGDIMFLSLPCTVVPRASITPEIMERMLAADNGISTSHFSLYKAPGGKVAITLNNFCKLQDLGRGRRGRYPLLRAFPAGGCNDGAPSVERPEVVTEQA